MCGDAPPTPTPPTHTHTHRHDKAAADNADGLGEFWEDSMVFQFEASSAEDRDKLSNAMDRNLKAGCALLAFLGF
jgi:hypothetical protein